ncbi:MAG TPA: shikimate kinase [Hyphomicrobiaceae bacterium]|nr:shikimate kinase [Hyphomicrobiaceae bacterium]
MRRDDISLQIGERVRKARAAAGLSRKRLAQTADVSERYLADLEGGGANASIGILSRVADALATDLISLIAAQGTSSTGRDTAKGPLASLAEELSSAEQCAVAPLVRRWLEERRRTLKGVALLGLRGAGKTTLGQMLAKRRKCPFVSVTREIETRAGMSLADLFNLAGPGGYRSLENEVVAEIAGRKAPLILETAGGIVGNAEALDVILGSFRTVWVRASPEEHLARVSGQGDMRPMRGHPRALEHLKTLLVAREPEYGRAECVLDTSGRSPAECLAELDRIADPVLGAVHADLP